MSRPSIHLPFCTCTGKNSGCKSEAVRVARNSTSHQGHPQGLDYLESSAIPGTATARGQPCVDCRIYLLRKAKEYMAECGADFVITGECSASAP